MAPFEIQVALQVFAAYLAIDWLYTEYTLSIVKLEKFKAAHIGAILYLLSAYGVINFVGDWRYVIPMAMGGWLGTFLSVWNKERA